MFDRTQPLELTHEQRERCLTGFTLMRMVEVFNRLQVIFPDQRHNQQVLQINYESFEQFLNAKRSLRQSKVSRKDLETFRIAYLRYNDFSINQIMKYLGCSQSPVYAGIDRFNVWLETESIPKYPEILQVYVNNPTLPYRLDELSKALFLLEYRKV